MEDFSGIKEWWELVILAVLLLLAWPGSWLLARTLRHRTLRAPAVPGGELVLEIWSTLMPLLRWGLMLAALAVGLHLIKPPPPVDGWLAQLLKAGFALLVAFVASRAAAVAFRHWAGRPTSPSESQSRKTLGPVAAKSCAVFFYIIAVLLVLQNMGYNVAGLMAGLGIGGVAIALAAKDTVANLFGSVAVLIDQPFSVGDYIRIGPTEGTAEKIGLRSTRVRTPDGYLVSIPNQNLTTSEIINLSARPTRRTVFTIGLVYELSAAQMEKAVEMLRGILAAHPQTADAWVHWKDFGPSSLDIQVVYWCKALAMSDFLDAVQELNVQIKEQFDAAGFGFAFPTQTVLLQKEE